MERVTVVIPARFGSSRFPGKPLARLAGKSLIQHVYEAVQDVSHVSQVIVATDDARIAQEVVSFHGCSIMVETPCRTGTDRVAAIAASVDTEYIVNLQADELIRDSSLLSDLILPFLESDAVMGTLKRRLQSQQALQDRSVVKVVTDARGRALYFSRAPIPVIRDAPPDSPMEDALHFVHLGMYIFRRETLRHFTALPTGLLEDAEKLEQLRALEWGIPITVWETTHDSFRIDTPEDLVAVQRHWESSCHE
ncbi:MAG: 3-deoxy-manno-octulosonate cytidylyltransferase [Nitrospirales bacterium]|nr:3-deoxy-manno-octulosonate cytidylyltransferase [Nitrospirales bacterium]